MNREEVIELLGLAPLPVEGGWFRQIWRSPPDAEQPAGTAIIAVLTDDEDGFSQFHRLHSDELWHFYGGDPIELVLLEPGGTSQHVELGADLAAGQRPVHVVVAGVWMAARTTGRWSLFGTTMAPGFTSDAYEGGRIEDLLAGWPGERDAILALTRAGSPLRMPGGL
jgi:predicted cupin superfamily sugar epimerase